MLIPRHRDGVRRRRRSVGLAMLLVMVVTACSTVSETPKPAGPATRAETAYTVNGVRYVPRADPHYDKIGTASWYGSRFHGRGTASGQRYDMNSMTAAHKTLPMGTRVSVTNLANRRSVVLTINDRGPFVRNRIIDVSRRAARELGFLSAGVAEVRVQLAQARNEPSDAGHFLPVLNRVMEQGTRLSEVFWTDPDNGSQGSIMPLTRPAEASRPFCRNYRRTAQAGTGRAVYLGRACREETGRWRIVRERKEGS